MGKPSTAHTRMSFPLPTLLLAVGAAVGFLFSIEMLAALLSPAPSSAAASSVLFGFMVWLLWGLFTPAMVWLSWRFPLQRTGLGKALAVHGVVSVAWAVVQVVLFGARQALATSMVWGVVAYWDLLLILTAIRQYGQLREMALTAAVLEKQLAQSELNALKMQLQPHFLFNALNSITSLVWRDPAAAEKMLARLGDFLRMTLEHREAQESTLREELRFLQAYLDIEKIRFGQRFSVELNVGPDAEDALLPALLLQPLVENSVRHGIARRAGHGRIVLRAKVQGEKLWLQVADSGNGFRVNNDGRIDVADGAGLSITRARLHETYGAGTSLQLSNPAEGGALVSVELPFRRQPLLESRPVRVSR